MAETNQLGIDVVARLDKLREELGKIPDIGGKAAKELAAQFSKEIKGAEKAAKDAAKASREAAAATKDFGDAAGEAGSNASKLAGFVGLISPEAGAAVQALGDLGDAGEVAAAAQKALGVSLGTVLAGAGALTAVLGAGAVAYHLYTESVAANEAALKRDKEATEQTLAIQREVIDATLKLANLKGEISDKEYARLAAAQTADQVFAAKKLTLIERINEENNALRRNEEVLAATSSALENHATGWTAMANAQAGAAAVERSNVAARDAAKAGIAEHTANIQRLGVELGDTVVLENLHADVLIETAEQTQANTDAEEARRKAIDELNAGLEAVLAQHAKYRATMEQLVAIGDRAEMARLDGIERVIAARDAEIEQARELMETARAAAGTNEDRRLQAEIEFLHAKEEITLSAEAEITAIEEKEQAERDKLREAAAAKEKTRLERQAAENLAHVNQVGGAITDGLGTLADSLDETYEHSADLADRLETQLAASEEYLTDAQKKALGKRIKAAREAAEKQFAAAKAAKIAESIASTALAAINAIAQSPPPSPFGVIGATIATAAGVAATAAISSTEPSFTDTTGVQRMGSGGSVHLADGDYFAAARDPNELQRQVGGGGPVVVETRWKHQMIDRTVSETYRHGGRLQRDIGSRTRSTPTGHRRR